MVRPSKEFLYRLKVNNERPQYRTAQLAGVDPVKLSKLTTGAERLKLGDPRILAVGAVLGLRAEECFEPCRIE
jgi:hypothetical protein